MTIYFLKHLARLTNLVILRLSGARLQVNRLANAGLAEEMVTSRNPHFKPELLK
jgi:hypothetical protein